KKDMVRALLKSLETKDPKPLGFINPKKYIQHNPRVEDGLAGFKKFVSGLPKETQVNTVRIFADGDYVVAHSEVTLRSRTATKRKPTKRWPTSISRSW